MIEYSFLSLQYQKLSVIMPISTQDYFLKLHSFHCDIIEFQNQNGDVFLIYLWYHVSSLAMNILTSFSAVASFGLKIQHFGLEKLTLRDTRTMAVWSVIVKKSSPKNLSADCRSTVGRLLVVCRPTVGRLLANCQPTNGRQSANCRPTGFAQSIGYLSADSRTTVGNVLVTCR